MALIRNKSIKNNFVNENRSENTINIKVYKLTVSISSYFCKQNIYQYE